MLSLKVVEKTLVCASISLMNLNIRDILVEVERVEDMMRTYGGSSLKNHREVFGRV